MSVAVLSELAEKRKAYMVLREEINSLVSELPGTVVEDCVLAGWDGPVRLSELFGDSEELLLVHNMGTGCSYCTMWGDEINGVLHYLESRVPVVVASPDDVDTQREFAAERGWNFRMVSLADSGLDQTLQVPRWDGEGMGTPDPGVSSLRRSSDGTITWHVHDWFGPGDHYSGAWGLLDLLPNGRAGFEPGFRKPHPVTPGG